MATENVDFDPGCIINCFNPLRRGGGMATSDHAITIPNS